MRRNVIVLSVIVGACVAVLGWWTYVRFFVKPAPRILSFTVTRGDLVEHLKVRGEVVAENSYDLAFKDPGTVAKVFVREGEAVGADAKLISLDTTLAGIELKRLAAARSVISADLASARAQLQEYGASRAAEAQRLAELEQGTRLEETNVQRSRVEAAQSASVAAASAAADLARSAYTVADDAIRNKADQIFNDPRSGAPSLRFAVGDYQLATSLIDQRIRIETELARWSQELAPAASVAAASAASSLQHLETTRAFLDDCALALGWAQETSVRTQATIDGWKTGVASARASVDSAASALSAAKEKLSLADADLKIAQDQLSLLSAGTRPEQIAAQKAVIEGADFRIKIQNSVVDRYVAALAENDAQSKSVQETIAQSTLTAPGAGQIEKLWLKKGEFFTPGKFAVSLVTSGHKVQADVSELDIAKIRERDGNPVQITFDALSGKTFSGKVISIDPQPVIKEGDRYFRMNVFLVEPDEAVRNGMSASLSISTASKRNVLEVAEVAISKREGKRYVTLLENGVEKEIEVTTGISDGENIEVTSGLNPGQTVILKFE